MNYKIDVLPDFARELKRLSKKYKSLKVDFANLLDELHDNPTAGVDLGNGVHKVRMSIGSKNRGKSHGARVITYVYEVDSENGMISLLDIYDKAERSTISKEEVARLMAIAKARTDTQ